MLDGGTNHRHHAAVSRWLPLPTTAGLTALGVVLATWPLAQQMHTATLRTGEVLLSAWQLNWFHQALLTDPLSWADANIFFPYDRTAALNDLLLTHALVTLPFAWADSPVLALNVAFMGGIVLCAVCAYLLIDELTDAPWAAMLGGVLFALTPFRFLHTGHLSIAAAWAIPLFFWALLRHLRQPSWGRAWLTAITGVAVGASSLYHAAFVPLLTPLVLLVGVRRGPGGRPVWVPLIATGAVGLVLLTMLLAPFVDAMQRFGVASAPSDLVRYAADLSSLVQRPPYLGGLGEQQGVNPEAHLYPGVGLTLLAVTGLLIWAGSLRALPRWQWRVVMCGALLMGVALGGTLVSVDGFLRGIWVAAVLALLWLGPLAAVGWAMTQTHPHRAVGAGVALHLGLAGAVVSFVLALGPTARYLAETVGPAPYRLLVAVTPAFAGTRVPARFGGLMMLFLALVGAAAAVQIYRAVARWLNVDAAAWGATPKVVMVRSIAALAIAGLLTATLSELPARATIPSLPDLHDPAYTWLRQQPGQFGILELPDWHQPGLVGYEYGGWRALRYMLASKQHGKQLVNGVGRIYPRLWYDLFRHDHWSPAFFDFIRSYVPVEYVVVHEPGLPVDSRAMVWRRVYRDDTGWREVFRADDTRVFRIDRTTAAGTVVDRMYLRHQLSWPLRISFSARVDPAAIQHGSPSEPPWVDPVELTLFQDEEPIASWKIDRQWRLYEAVTSRAPAAVTDTPWPRTGVMFRWQVRREDDFPFALKDLVVAPAVLE